MWCWIFAEIGRVRAYKVLDPVLAPVLDLRFRVAGVRLCVPSVC